jgi:glucose/arabinose dehydrogenase
VPGAAELGTFRPPRLSLAAAPLLIACWTGCAKDKPGATPVELGPTTSAAEVDPTPRSTAACGPRGLPPDRHFVAEGLCARVVAHDQGPLRGITFSPNGDLLAVTLDGELKRYRDVDHDGLYGEDAPETIVWATTGSETGHDCHLDGQDLYCGSRTGVKRWRYAPDLDHGGPGEDVIVGMPEGGRHPKHPVAVWDGFLYAASGSDDNANANIPLPADYDTNRNAVKRFPIDRLGRGRPVPWKDGEIVVRGVRNVSAMARDSGGHLIAIDNGPDDVAHGGIDVRQDNPGEGVIALEPGRRYGYPFCFFAQRIVAHDAVTPPGTPLASDGRPMRATVRDLARTAKSSRDDAWCMANVDRPISLVQAHSSALGLVFPERASRFALAERWRGGAFVALHGSSERDASTGNKVIWLPFDASGTAPMPTSTKDATAFPYEVVFGGGKYGAPRDGEWSWKLGDAGEDPVRPVGVAISPVDGALYVTSDSTDGALSARSGAIYRIALLGR